MKRLLVGLAVLLVTGCASLGLEQPKTFKDRLAYAYGVNTAVRIAATDALRTQQISAGDALHVKLVNDQVREALDAADILSVTDLGAAEGRLIAAARILTEVQEYLRQRGVKTSFNQRGGDQWALTWQSS